MAAIYTTRKKDEETGVATVARELAASLDAAAAKCIVIADEDEVAYAAVQASWKDESMSAEDKAKVEAAALDVPVKLLKLCHAQSKAVAEFLPKCNPNITSDAKVCSCICSVCVCIYIYI
jgi:formiminotetrahydrofolate cyclodeaminase